MRKPQIVAIAFLFAACGVLMIACSEAQTPVEPSANQEASIAKKTPGSQEAPGGGDASAGQPVSAGEEEILGGPCLSERPTPEGYAASSAIRERHAAAMKNADRAAAIEAQKQLIQYQCANEYLWFQLATLQVEAGKNSDAVAVLEYLYGKQGNDVTHRLDTQTDPLHALARSREFRESALAKNLAADRQRFEERQEEFRKKLAALPADQKPARNYVAKNACPFECCTYRTWNVLADTVLYDQPNGQKVVARITKGAKVEALTGEVHLSPAPVAVLATPPESTVPPGSIVFVLDNLGEGFAHVWHEGRILDLSAYLGVREQCTFPGTEEGCWGEWLDRPDAAQAWSAGVWWAQIKTPAGVTGWTIVRDNFGNMDSCG